MREKNTERKNTKTKRKNRTIKKKKETERQRRDAWRGDAEKRNIHSATHSTFTGTAFPAPCPSTPCPPVGAGDILPLLEMAAKNLFVKEEFP